MHYSWYLPTRCSALQHPRCFILTRGMQPGGGVSAGRMPAACRNSPGLCFVFNVFAAPRPLVAKPSCALKSRSQHAACALTCSPGAPVLSGNTRGIWGKFQFQKQGPNCIPLRVTASCLCTHGKSQLLRLLLQPVGRCGSVGLGSSWVCWWVKAPWYKYHKKHFKSLWWKEL